MALPSLFAVIQDDLAILEKDLLAMTHSPVDMVTEIGKHLIQAGGKRLRPALYLLCAGNGRGERQRITAVAAALEMIHMATLVHDDVIDEAATRRGKPTANSLWGNSNTVLGGDYLFARAFAVLARANTGPAMLTILADVICAMCEGEIIQSRDCFNTELSEADYCQRTAKKTALFMAASCELGGMEAGLPEQTVRQLKDYGYALGMAFQITDDILDVTGSADQVGKPVGNDLRQGVITLPVIYALRTSSRRSELRTLIRERAVTDRNLPAVLAAVEQAGAVEYSYRIAAGYLEQARNFLPAGLDGDRRAALLKIADFVGSRRY